MTGTRTLHHVFCLTLQHLVIITPLTAQGSPATSPAINLAEPNLRCASRDGSEGRWKAVPAGSTSQAAYFLTVPSGVVVAYCMDRDGSPGTVTGALKSQELAAGRNLFYTSAINITFHPPSGSSVITLPMLPGTVIRSQPSGFAIAVDASNVVLIPKSVEFRISNVFVASSPSVTLLDGQLRSEPQDCNVRRYSASGTFVSQNVPVSCYKLLDQNKL